MIPIIGDTAETPQTNKPDVLVSYKEVDRALMVAVGAMRMMHGYVTRLKGEVAAGESKLGEKSAKEFGLMEDGIMAALASVCILAAQFGEDPFSDSYMKRCVGALALVFAHAHACGEGEARRQEKDGEVQHGV